MVTLSRGNSHSCHAAVAHEPASIHNKVTPCAWRTTAVDVRTDYPSRPSAREWPCLQQSHPGEAQSPACIGLLGGMHMRAVLCYGSCGRQCHLVCLLPCVMGTSRPLPELRAPTHAGCDDLFLCNQARMLGHATPTLVAVYEIAQSKCGVATW